MNEEKNVSDVEILKGEPIDIVVGGQTIKVNRLSFDRQQEAIELISDVYDGKENTKSSPMSRVTNMALNLVSFAIEKKPEEVKSITNVAEIMIAFKKIWNQNGFDFLVNTVADLNK